MSEKHKVTISKLIDGESAEVQICFKANPKPDSGEWIMGKTVEKIPKTIEDLNSTNKIFVSTTFDSRGENEYCVKLHFTMKKGNQFHTKQ